jgi:signal transduction histidine kinase
VARVLHDVADALAVGLGAAWSGGLGSPVWLLLYPHVVGVSVRGGLRYAMTLGTLDALLVYWLALLSPSHPLGELNAPAILFCAFLGGSTSSFLHRIRTRLAETNRALEARNAELATTVGQVREANARLEDLHRLRDEYLRNVSHEFRSPLTVIRGYAEFVRDQGVPSDTSLRDVMGVLLDSCDQMIDMVDTLLEVSRIEQGETSRRLDLRKVALRELLDTALASVRGLAEKKDATIEVSLPTEPETASRCSRWKTRVSESPRSTCPTSSRSSTWPTGAWTDGEEAPGSASTWPGRSSGCTRGRSRC